MVNPHQQLLDPFNWVMDWECMLSVSSMVGLLDKNFFPKWLQVLCSWLSNNPNYEEITKWYLGWKGLLSENLLSHPLVKEKLNEALDIMNRAVASGLGQSHTKKIMFTKFIHSTFNFSYICCPCRGLYATWSKREHCIPDSDREKEGFPVRASARAARSGQFCHTATRNGSGASICTHQL